VRRPAADGYATYMVASLSPVILIHLPIGDGYHFDMATRWNAKDIKSMIDREKEFRNIFTYQDREL
jgi:hypothetical protein